MLIAGYNRRTGDILVTDHRECRTNGGKKGQVVAIGCRWSIVGVSWPPVPSRRSNGVNER